MVGHPPIMRVAVLFSGGKDSAYALHCALTNGFDVGELLVLKPSDPASWLFHVPGEEAHRSFEELTGIPVKVVETGSEELKTLREEFRRLKEEGYYGVYTGALLSDYQRINYNQAAYSEGLVLFSPLWRKNQEEYMRHLAASGFTYTLLTITAEGLPPELLGAEIGEEEVERIIELSRKYGFNPSFEGGEAETLILSAPLFRRRLEVDGEVEEVGPSSYRLEIREVRVV
ncbi:MAG TPA: diphthine--ammonia ligase [Euryarchaeota archaeon]|nr:MAG: diphthine--ammonia ligase [Thermoplasmata archaeon]HDD59705.1 diphthine--ammonia ligase [Euryarchaeota archaeon]